MELNRISSKVSTRPGYLDETFQLTLSGEELLRLWFLSWDRESGSQHPGPNRGRFHEVIEESLGLPQELAEDAEHLRSGKYEG
jgi:hypothetical protein